MLLVASGGDSGDCGRGDGEFADSNNELHVVRNVRTKFPPPAEALTGVWPRKDLGVISES